MFVYCSRCEIILIIYVCLMDDVVMVWGCIFLSNCVVGGGVVLYPDLV